MNIFQKFEKDYNYPADEEVHEKDYDIYAIDAIYDADYLRYWLHINHKIFIAITLEDEGFSWDITEPDISLKGNKEYETIHLAQLSALHAVYDAFDFIKKQQTTV